MILTKTAAKRDFYLIRHFGIKMSPAPRHTHSQDVLGVKIVTSSCPASSRSCQAVLLRKYQQYSKHSPDFTLVTVLKWFQ